MLVFDIFEAILKGCAILIRLWVEGGFLEVSLSHTGRFFIKVFYPPHWFKNIRYNRFFERFIGAIIWGFFSYGLYYIYQNL